MMKIGRARPRRWPIVLAVLLAAPSVWAAEPPAGLKVEADLPYALLSADALTKLSGLDNMRWGQRRTALKRFETVVSTMSAMLESQPLYGSRFAAGVRYAQHALSQRTGDRISRVKNAAVELTQALGAFQLRGNAPLNQAELQTVSLHAHKATHALFSGPAPQASKTKTRLRLRNPFARRGKLPPQSSGRGGPRPAKRR